MSLRDDLLKPKPRTESLEVPGKGTVYLLRWNGKERAAWDSYVQNITTPDGDIHDTAALRATAVQMGVANEDGTLVFGFNDIEALKTSEGDWQAVVYLALCALNKLTNFDARSSAASFFQRIAVS